MKNAYLKTARLRDQSTSGFLSSNFARLFIRCRPPNINAAYRAENRNDFFLQNRTKKHLSRIYLVLGTQQSHIWTYLPRARAFPWKGKSFEDTPAAQLILLLAYEPTCRHTGLAPTLGKFWKRTAKFGSHSSPVSEDWTSVRKRTDTAELRHNTASTTQLILEPADHVLRLIYLFCISVYFLQAPCYLAI